jgi:hypothetical protein
MAYQAPDYGGYERQKGDIEYKYGTDSAANAYGRFLGQQRYERSAGDASRNFGRAYAPTKSRFGQRGLAGGGVRSGAMQQSMGNFIGDYQRDYTRGLQDQTQANQQYDLQQANYDQWRQQALQGVETDKANDIAWAAQNLQMMRELLGTL